MGTVELILAVVTAVGVFLGPMLAERFREAHAVRRERLSRLKSIVFGSLTQQLIQYYLPVLSLQRASVGIITERVPKDSVPPDQPAEDWRASLAVITPDDTAEPPGLFWHHRHQPSAEAEGMRLLLSEARNRYPSFFKRWDQFLEDYRTYQEACLGTIDSTYRQIQSNVRLPEFSLTIKEPPWVNAQWLACYAFFRSIDLVPARMPLVARDSGSFIEIQYQNSSVGVGPKEAMEACMELVGNIPQAPALGSSLDQRRRKLLGSATAFNQEIQRMLLA